jgi:UDP-glucose 4-epimerase
LRILVTGGAGFIGSHIVDGLIAHGHDTYVVDDLSGGKLTNLEQARKEGGVTFHSYDIASEAVGDLFEQVRPEVVVHMAAQASVPASVADPIFDAQVNIIGLLRILDASLALANVYGPRQDPHGEAGVIAIFARKLINGALPTIFGTGEQTRDFVYVEDVAHAFVRATEHGSAETVNIATGIETTINELYLIVAESAGVTDDAIRGPARSGDVFRNALDPRKAAKILDWAPWTSLDAGITRTIEWFRANPEV